MEMEMLDASLSPMPRRVISAFILLQIAVVISESVPARPFAAITRVTGPYARRIGLFQNWSMFAPNPQHVNAYVDAEITYQRGQVRVWAFPQMQELGYFERYRKERYRKWSNERLASPENSALWPDAARYIARLNADAFNPPRMVKLVYCSSAISPPPAPGQPRQSEQWQRRVFFAYNVKPGDL